jgi:hypothetical protein
MNDVIDHGGTWVFRFSAQGHDVGEVSVDRSQLAADNWELTVPSSVGAQLRDAGASPTPKV